MDVRVYPGPDQVCSILSEWLTLVETRYQEGGFPNHLHFQIVGRDAMAIRTSIAKSSYLGRRLWGEPHLTTPCPVHLGRWSGLLAPNANACGCGGVGWLR